MKVHEFDLGDFPDGRVTVETLHLEIAAHARLSASFSHVDQRGRAVSVHFVVDESNAAVRDLIDAHSSPPRELRTSQVETIPQRGKARVEATIDGVPVVIFVSDFEVFNG